MLMKSDLPAKQLSLEMRIALKQLNQCYIASRSMLSRDRTRMTKKQQKAWWASWVELVKPITIDHTIHHGGKFANKGDLHTFMILDLESVDQYGSYDVYSVGYDDRKRDIQHIVKACLKISGHALEQVIRRTNVVGIDNIGAVLSKYAFNAVRLMMDHPEIEQGQQFTLINRNGYVGIEYDGFNMIIKTYIPVEQYHAKRRQHLGILTDQFIDDNDFLVVSRDRFDRTYQQSEPLTIERGVE